jgi:hypothetical protein
MTLEQWTSFFGWTAVVNLAFLMVSWTVFSLAREWAYSVHNRWLPMSREQWSHAIFVSYAGYKIATFAFFVVPWIALKIISA